MKPSSKLEVTINVIIHATEDVSKFLVVFEEIFGLSKDQFFIQNLAGHYDNPITVMKIKLLKKDAKNFVETLMKMLNDQQRTELFENMGERIENSTLHIRLDKQEFVNGKIVFKQKDAIKLKISTPIYRKEDKVKTFRDLLEFSN